MRIQLAAAAGIAALTLPHAFAQTAPCAGTTLAGTVRDNTQALIPGATLTLDGSRHATSGADGRYRFTCVGDGSHRLSAIAQGFAQGSFAVKAPHGDPVDLVLQLASVEAEVSVDGESEPIAMSNTPQTTTIAGKELQQLADDPDDLLRELQQLAAAAGGSAANATISVDGFQDSSSLPPKSSIAYIKVNPDLFAAENRQPPFEGGRVEIYTKPGQKVFHGALFATNGSAWENARDPYSAGKAPIGKQRYGFELSGPVSKTGSDFSLALEHRSIDNFAAVNAVDFDSAANPINVSANVATPQRLWIGNARTDWQLGAKNTFIASFSVNVSHLENVGVGGTSLVETGYDSEKTDNTIRFSDVTTASAHLMHEARLSLRWYVETDRPNTTAPQLQIAGAFTGGGATIGAKHSHVLTVEADDDAIVTTKNHTVKFGTQIFLFDDHRQLPTNFNGTYTFGGGTAPVLDANNQPIAGQTQTITGVQQYQRALLSLPGGTATAFTNVAGTPDVGFVEFQGAVFLDDDWKLPHGFHITSGLRYYLQTDPTMLNTLTPRAGILWSPNSKGTWTLHAHAGMFGGILNNGSEAEMLREDGGARVTSTIYNPVYGNPFQGATPIHSIRRYGPGIDNTLWGMEEVGGTRVLPYGFNLSGEYVFGRFWNYQRTNNINSPLNGLPTGPRPGAANLNILQMQNSGQGHVNGAIAKMEQHSFKWVQFFVSGLWVDSVDDSDDNPFFTPQSSTSNAGELAHRTGQPGWHIMGNGTLTLPEKVQLSTDFAADGEAHYNITTGFDNNGDGDFNDRPQYAPAGTPLCASAPTATPCAIPTQYGLLTSSGGVGVFPRNQGVMPWTIHLDMNVQRVFHLTRNAKADHRQTLTVNLRSSNVLNHLNVTAVGGVLGSPLFGVPYAADNGRRVEAGVRYSF